MGMIATTLSLPSGSSSDLVPIGVGIATLSMKGMLLVSYMPYCMEGPTSYMILMVVPIDGVVGIFAGSVFQLL
jgi:hypothetical protein